MEVFNIENLTYSYPDREAPAIAELDLKIENGEFLLVAGPSGSGKSTLARVISGLVPEFYGGSMRGRIRRAKDVGMVFQDPEKQLVMETVEREVAFPLENRGMERSVMRKQVLEVLSFLGIWYLKDKKTYELSGGEKQKVAIAAALAGRDRFLVLDEPVSQLDPMAAEEIMNLLKKLNDDLGFTIILVEQRMEKCLAFADRVLFMDEGKIIFDGTPSAYAKWVQVRDRSFLPTVAELFSRMDARTIPLTIKEGRRLLEKEYDVAREGKDKEETGSSQERNMVFRKVEYSFEDGTRALKSVTLDVGRGESLGIIGANGAGKSTTLRLMAGLLKPSKGALEAKGSVGYLSQEPNDYLFNDSVFEELRFTQRNFGMENTLFIDRLLEELKLTDFRDVNPRDLSVGERQRVALASVLAMDPAVLLLDEPTRGLNKNHKNHLAAYLRQIRNKGKSVVLVTHDMEFVAETCDRVAIMFEGEIAQMGPVEDVLRGGLHFTTDINRLFQGTADPLKIEEAMALCRKKGCEGP